MTFKVSGNGGGRYSIQRIQHPSHPLHLLYHFFEILPFVYEMAVYVISVLPVEHDSRNNSLHFYDVR